MLEQIRALIQEEIKQYMATSTSSNVADSYGPAIFARQPVFNTAGKIWGYELLYRRPSNQASANVVRGAVATAHVIVSGTEIASQGLTAGQRLLINFPSDMIEAQIIQLLPKNICVLEILEDVIPTPEVLAAVADIKKAGYMIALDDFIGQEQLRAFLPYADIVKLEVLGLSDDEIRRNTLIAQKCNCTLLAEKTEDERIVKLCRELGYSLFQGYFFSKPEIVQGKKISTSQAARLNILALCTGNDLDLKALSEVILHDPLITARLLKFINSAHYSFSSPINSVARALQLMGQVTIMQWLCINVLATLETNPISQEISFLASQRAKFLENLGKALQTRNALPNNISPSSLFLTGLFSLLESVIGVSIADALEGVPLQKEVLDTLTGSPSPYTAWLQLMEIHDQGHWKLGLQMGKALGINESDLSMAYTDALKWSAAFFTR
ncbi:MAG: HDOD domain-containing protein [Deltaproteobacteria bacterium]|nr:HDOD domain-containing protein [Deltaproteobacteria bacterium]